MKSKTRKVLIVIISIILILFGIIIYLRYTKSPDVEKEVIMDNYYNSEFLFNNNYLKLADLVSDSRKINKDLDIHGANNVLYINLLTSSTEINGLPSNATVYFNHLENDCYEFAALKGNDLYYAKTCLTDKNKKTFEKISTIAKDVYVPNIYKKGIYVTENPTSNFIINTTLKELKYISYKEKTLGLYNDISKINPYFDYVCASSNASVCKKMMVYVSFENELYFNNQKIKTNDNKDLLVNDLFGVLTVDTKDNIIIDSLDYDKLNKYNYIFKVYALSKDNYLYEIEIKKGIDEGNITGKKILNDKIKLIDYKKDKNSNINAIIVTDINGKIISFVQSSKNSINTSTIYDRKSLIDTLKK